MERKIFWITFTILGVAADFCSSDLVGTSSQPFPSALWSWWAAYRSDSVLAARRVAA